MAFKLKELVREAAEGLGEIGDFLRLSGGSVMARISIADELSAALKENQQLLVQEKKTELLLELACREAAAGGKVNPIGDDEAAALGFMANYRARMPSGSSPEAVNAATQSLLVDMNDRRRFPDVYGKLDQEVVEGYLYDVHNQLGQPFVPVRKDGISPRGADLIWASNGLPGRPLIDAGANGLVDPAELEARIKLVKSHPNLVKILTSSTLSRDRKNSLLNELVGKKQCSERGWAGRQRSTRAVDEAAAAAGRKGISVAKRIGGAVRSADLRPQKEVRVSSLSSLQEQQTARVAANRGISYGEAEQAFKIAQLHQQAQANLQQADTMETGSGITEERIPARGTAKLLGKIFNVR